MQQSKKLDGAAVLDDLGRMAEATKSIATYLRNLSEDQAALPCAPALAGAEALHCALVCLVEQVNALSTAQNEPSPTDAIIDALEHFLPQVFAAVGVDCDQVSVSVSDEQGS